MDEHGLGTTSFREKTGMVLRAFLSELPGGGALVNYISDKAAQEFEQRLRRIEKVFVDTLTDDSGDPSKVRRITDGFQLLRLRRYLHRSCEVVDDEWLDLLADTWAEFLTEEGATPELQAEADRVMLALEPHDLRLLRECSAYQQEAAADRIAKIGTTAGAPIGLSHQQISKRLNWPAAVVVASAGRVLALNLVEDALLNVIGGYEQRLGACTALGTAIIERAAAATMKRPKERR